MEMVGKEETVVKSNHELARIGPGGLVEAFDGNTATSVVEPASVNNVGSFLSVLRHNVFGREAIGCYF